MWILGLKGLKTHEGQKVGHSSPGLCHHVISLDKFNVTPPLFSWPRCISGYIT